ncbi:50S ribosomal protein L3 [Candidatus Micrarchaeota archaeon CG10_big_fil_rev_8_21_14_0_10_45_29]|nr:MAG: 50S ribosomal protein L3 [Candidatus Micrarchaeota archaeon CG10_big_fil_rev_8_21_14_0_10_45_29]
MAKHNRPRKGSLAFNPRKRANKQTPTINFWAEREEPSLLGFAGYKAGMTTISYIDDSNSPNKNTEVFIGATIVEAPSLVIYGIRAFKDGQIKTDKICTDEKILKEMGMKLKKKNEIKAEDADDIFVLAYTRPSKCGFGKKHIEKMMIGVGGKDTKAKLDYANSILGKEVKASEAIKPGEYVDTFAVSIGRGWQGQVKRFGTSIQRRKATGKRRHIGNMGAFGAHGVHHTVPMAGQMGYHNRHELNKRVMKIATPEEVNPSGGFPHYGVVKNECLLILGSITGPKKRLIRMRKAVRKAEIKAPDVKEILNTPQN